jgi:hypothetical protein
MTFEEAGVDDENIKMLCAHCPVEVLGPICEGPFPNTSGLPIGPPIA